MQKIGLSHFLQVSGHQDARLVISNTTNESTITTANEGFVGRILSFLGKFPPFKNISSVKNHIESIKTENQITIVAFAEALSNSYGVNTADKVISAYHLSSGDTPLTQRKIQTILLPAAQTMQAKEAFVQELVQKYGANIAQQALTMNNFIAAGSDKNNLKASIIVTEGTQPDYNTVEALAKNLQQATLASSLISLTRIEGLQKLSGLELKTKYSQLSEGNGALRTLQTLLTNLSNLSSIPGMADFQHTIKSVFVGNSPFSQWGTTGGSVEAWVNSASQDDLSLAAERIQGITKDVIALKEKLQAYQSGHPVQIKPPKLNLPRFTNISVNPNTQICLQDKTPMPANIMSIGGTPVAIACSYPKGTLSGIESHLRMILEQKPSCLVVLTGDDQIQGKKLPDYFRQPSRIGSINTQVTQGASIQTPSGVDIDNYHLKLSSGPEAYSLPVIHVQSWKDHHTLQNVYQLLELAQITIETSNTIEPIYENTKPTSVPMIHCFGGVGRTGSLITAIELLKNPSLSCEQIIADLRDCRNKKMVEDKPQQRQLRQLEHMLCSRISANYRT
ncbi:protein-tyrosine phosphatase family protein [Providencia rustigianii]|uniref:protein-tyrosine phosphatase family protein n=1 Tax=Providencia rustigianii TaxID=158850 RepID=UPI0038B34F4C